MTPMITGISSAPVARSTSWATRPRTACLAVPCALLALAIHPGRAAAQDADGGAPAPTEATGAPIPPAPVPEPPPPAPTAQKAGQAATLAPPAPSQNRRPSQGMPAPAEIPGQGAPEAISPYTRAPLRVSFGQGSNAWAFTLFGVVQADYLHDTTRSYDESIGANLVARTDTYEGTVGRTQFTARNSRFGFILESPTLGGVTPSATILMDFPGNQPGTPYPYGPGGVTGGEQLSEGSYYGNATPRLRYGYLTLRSAILDLVAGETVDIFGWQSYFQLCSLGFVPNQIATRNTQIRLSHAFGLGGPITLDVAVEAARPAQRDSEVPDAMGAVRIAFPGWKGVTTAGNAITLAAPLSFSVSGVTRQFKVNAFAPPPPQSSNSATGWGVSVDAFLPIIPASNAQDRNGRLTLIGSFVYGTGIADLQITGGGAQFPTLPNPALASPPPVYTPDVDNGLVSFDTLGVLHTIDWYTAKAGAQLYLPQRLILTVNGTYAHSKNMAKLFPMGGAEIELLGAVADSTEFGEAALLWDATAAVRFTLGGQYTRVHYLDGNEPHNVRGIFQALYVF